MLSNKVSQKLTHVAWTVSSLRWWIWRAPQKAGPAHRLQGTEAPAAQLGPGPLYIVLAAFVLSYYNSTFLFSNWLCRWVRLQELQYWSYGYTCMLQVHVYTPHSLTESSHQFYSSASFNTQHQTLKLDWTDATTDGRTGWLVCHSVSSASPAIETRWHCNKPSRGLCANTLKGISLSQKEQMSFVTNGNGFSAQT